VFIVCQSQADEELSRNVSAEVRRIPKASLTLTLPRDLRRVRPRISLPLDVFVLGVSSAVAFIALLSS